MAPFFAARGGDRLMLQQAGTDRHAAGASHPTANTKGYSSTYLAMGFANARAGTRVFGSRPHSPSLSLSLAFSCLLQLPLSLFLWPSLSLRPRSSLRSLVFIGLAGNSSPYENSWDRTGANTHGRLLSRVCCRSRLRRPLVSPASRRVKVPPGTS